jgi:hypothetical protein
MRSESDLQKYVVDFFHSGNRGARPTDSMCLKASKDSDAIAQAAWLARHTCHHHFQVRAVANGVHTIIYRSSPLAIAA